MDGHGLGGPPDIWLVGLLGCGMPGQPAQDLHNLNALVLMVNPGPLTGWYAQFGSQLDRDFCGWTEWGMA